MTRLHWETEVYNSLLKSAGKPQMTALLRARVLDCAVGLTLIVPMIGCHNSTATKFAGVSRAAKAVEAATVVGVNNPRFHELMLNLYTEISIARDQVATDRETNLLKQYEDSAEIYFDSLQLWDKQDKEVIEICGLSVPSGTKSVTLSTCVQSLPVEARNLTGLAEKYGLPVMIHGPSYGVAYFTVPASSVQQVWRVGHEKLKASNSALHDSQ